MAEEGVERHGSLAARARASALRWIPRAVMAREQGFGAVRVMRHPRGSCSKSRLMHMMQTTEPQIDWHTAASSETSALAPASQHCRVETRRIV